MLSRILTLSFLVISLSAISAPTVIYGEDDRKDVYEVDNALYLELSISTAAMIAKNKLGAASDGVITLTGKTMEERGICAEEKFSSQITAAMCSGFLVAPDLLVTAGHCVDNASDCNKYNWVFNYRHESEKQTEIEIAANDVYECQEIVERSLDWRSKDDYALIKLKRPVMDRMPLTYRTEGKVEVGDDLVVIGHPTGLPTKIADGANVRSNDRDTFFVANLDTYGGNSGSAVFNATTGIVEGILVRGETDYVRSSGRSCRVSNICSDTGCRGEDVTRITNILALQSL